MNDECQIGGARRGQLCRYEGPASIPQHRRPGESGETRRPRGGCTIYSRVAKEQVQTLHSRGHAEGPLNKGVLVHDL